MDNHARGQSVGNAAKIASELTQLSLTTGMDPDAVFAVYQGLLAQVANEVITLNEAVEVDTTPAFAQAAAATATAAAPQPAQFNPQASLQQAFPGSTVVAAPTAPAVVAPPANVVPFPGGPAPAPIPAAAAPGAGDPEIEGYWNLFFQDLRNGTWAANWTDNRAAKRGANSPDFKHNSLKQTSNQRYNVSLYIEGRKNPAWVADKLRQFGVVS